MWDWDEWFHAKLVKKQSRQASLSLRHLFLGELCVKLSLVSRQARQGAKLAKKIEGFGFHFLRV